MDRYQTAKSLLYYLRASPDGPGERKAGALSVAGWGPVVEESIRHGVAPLLYYRLKTACPDITIPAEATEKLRKAYLENSARNMALYRKLGNILEIFRRAGIPVIALKGAHLADAAYQNIALRQMDDADLLVRRADLAMVHDIMVSQGYLSSKEDVFTDPNHLPPYRKENSLKIEAHFNIIGPPISHRIDIENLWARARKVRIEGVEVLTLCPEDLLIHLCAHAGFKHGFETGIRPLIDILYTIEHYGGGLDWGQALNRSREWGVEKCLYLGLSLAKKFTGVPVPEEIMRRLDIYDDAFNAVTRAEEFIFGEGGPVAANVARLCGEDSLRHKLAHFMRYAFPPKDAMAGMQPAGGNPLSFYILYLHRIKGLVKRHGRTAWRLLLRDKELSASARAENRRNELRDWLAQAENAL